MEKPIIKTTFLNKNILLSSLINKKVSLHFAQYSMNSSSSMHHAMPDTVSSPVEQKQT